MNRIAFISIITLLGIVESGARAESPEVTWPQFRGPSSSGSAINAQLPESWSTTENVEWKTSIAGKGWSSPIVWGNRVFVTTVVGDEQEPEARKGFYVQGKFGTTPTGTHRWLVICLDLKTGRKLWQKEVHHGASPHAMHLKNTFASETPVTDGKRVFAYFGNVGLFCLNFDGELLWSRSWDAVKMRNGLGMGASPTIYNGHIYVVNDNESKSFLSAIEAATGKEIWQVERDEKSNWASPFVWQNDLRTEIVTAGSGKIRSYDLNGKLLWEMNDMSKTAIPTPMSALGLLFVTSGQFMDSLRPLYAIRPGATGDISLTGEADKNDFIAWSLPLAGPYHPSPVVVGELLFVLHDRGFLACYDARTGDEIYSKKRVGPATFTASPWTDGKQLYCLNEDGETFVVSGGTEFKVLGSNRLEAMCVATPAIAGDRLLIRTSTDVYCLGSDSKSFTASAQKY